MGTRRKMGNVTTDASLRYSGVITFREARVMLGLPADGVPAQAQGSSVLASRRARASNTATKRGTRASARRGRT